MSKNGGKKWMSDLKKIGKIHARSRETVKKLPKKLGF